MLAAMPEMWKDIPGYEGLYAASTYGRVAALEKTYYAGNGVKKHKKAHILKFVKNGDGYLKTALSKGGKRKDPRLHQLVAVTFLPNPENKPEVNHKDLNKENNHLWNLEWNTRSENNKHAFDNGANDVRKYVDGNRPSILCIDIETGIFYDSIKEAAKAKGINKVSMEAMLRGRYRNKTSIRYA